MQRPGRDPADPPSPSPWPAAPDEAVRTRVAGDGWPAPGTAAPAAGSAPEQPYGQAGPHAASRPYPGRPYAQTGPYAETGSYPPAGPYPPAEAHRPTWPPSRRELTTAAAVIAALAVLGAVLGLLWVQLAPRLAFRVVQPGRAMPVVPEAEEYVAADGRFVLLTLAAGLLAGLVCWLLRPTRGPVVLVALALGCLLGAVVTWRVGLWLAPGYRPEDLQEVGRTVYPPLELGALAALVVQPVAAVLVYLFGAGLTARNDLGTGEDARQAPPAALS